MIYRSEIKRFQSNTLLYVILSLYILSLKPVFTEIENASFNMACVNEYIKSNLFIR